jgi:HEPN domain-containing protein
MREDTRLWLDYAEENFEMARLALEHGYLNACLQNACQAVEKALKALLLERRGAAPQSSRIRELGRLVAAEAIPFAITDKECDLLDSIDLPSRYPTYGESPAASADWKVCIECVRIADRILAGLRDCLSAPAG